MNPPLPPVVSSVPPRITREKARLYTLINLLGGPGMGTWMSGRRLTGAMQFLLAVAGIVLVFLALMKILSGVIEGNLEQTGFPTIGWAGFGSFILAWVWALVSSLELWREARVTTRQ